MKLHNISINNLRRRRGKMLFLVLGLMIGIGTIVALLSITDSLSRDIEERLDKFGANIIMTPKNDKLSLNYGGINVGGVTVQIEEFQESDLVRIREIKDKQNLGAIAPKVLGSVQINDQDVLLMGVDLEIEFVLKSWWDFQGKQPLLEDEVLIGNEAAKALKVSVGEKINLNGEDYYISAVLKNTGGQEDYIIIGDLHRVQKTLGKEGRVSLVEIAAFCRDCPIEEMVLQIADKFPGSRVTALKQAVTSKMQSIELFRAFSYGIAGLVMIIGSLLVFVTMMGAVNERTREIGIFRAIGFRRGHIMHIILFEAAFLGFVGGLMGFLGGNLLAVFALPLVIKGASFSGLDLVMGMGAVSLAISLSVIASLWPAYKASNLDPSEALRAL